MSLHDAPFEAIDNNITLDVNAMGMVPRLHDQIRRIIGGSPSRLAASAIVSAKTENKARVLIVTGYPVPYPFSKTREVHSDGPIGVAALAKTLFSGFGIKSTILVDEGLGRIQSSVLAALEIPNEDVRVEEFPKHISKPLLLSLDLLDRLEPCAIIASEKTSRNSDGVYHTALGDNLTEFVSQLDYIFYEANTRRIPTVGIGDFGNEIGFGLIRNSLPSILPNGGKCKCGCPGGIGAFTETQHVIVGAMSDWGAYGLIAALALIARNHSLIPDISEVEVAMDAFAKQTSLERADELMTDHIPISRTGALLRDLKQIVAKTVNTHSPD